MATSGTYVASLTVANAMDEALERCGMDPSKVTMRHILSARRSMDLMLKAWSNLQIMQWAIEYQTQALTQGDDTFTTPVGTIDVLDAVLIRDGSSVEMTPIGRAEYQMLPVKTTQGRPNRFMVRRERDSVTVTLWNVPENSTDVMGYYRIRALQDVGGAINDLDIPQRYYDAFCADLAARLAVKWAPERRVDLQGQAVESMTLARNEDRERAPTRIRARLR